MPFWVDFFFSHRGHHNAFWDCHILKGYAVMPKTLSIWDIYLNQLTRFKNKFAVSCLALWVNRRVMICEGYRYVTRLKRTRSFIIWRPPAMNISLVDVQLTSIKQDGLSCVSPLLSLQGLSRTQESFILEKLRAQSRLGKSRSFFCFPGVCRKD